MKLKIDCGTEVLSDLIFDVKEEEER